MTNHKDIQRRFRSLSAFLDERMRRLVAAAESEAIRYGGVSAVALATGVSRRAITEGTKELKQRKASRGVGPSPFRIRRKDLIAATTTANGLAVKSKLDPNLHPAGLKVSDQQMAELQLRRDKFHGDWNYSLISKS